MIWIVHVVWLDFPRDEFNSKYELFNPSVIRSWTRIFDSYGDAKQYYYHIRKMDPFKDAAIYTGDWELVRPFEHEYKTSLDDISYKVKRKKH